MTQIKLGAALICSLFVLAAGGCGDDDTADSGATEDDRPARGYYDNTIATPAQCRAQGGEWLSNSCWFEGDNS